MRQSRFVGLAKERSPPDLGNLPGFGLRGSHAELEEVL